MKSRIIFLLFFAGTLELSAQNTVPNELDKQYTPGLNSMFNSGSNSPAAQKKAENASSRKKFLVDFGFGYQFCRAEGKVLYDEKFLPGTCTPHVKIDDEEIFNSLDIFIGGYKPLFAPANNFSMGLNTDAIFSIGLDPGLLGVQIPVHAMLRVGNNSTMKSSWSWGGALGAGVCLTAFYAQPNDNDKATYFSPVVTFEVGQDSRVRFDVILDDHQTYYKTVCGKIPHYRYFFASVSWVWVMNDNDE